MSLTGKELCNGCTDNGICLLGPLTPEGFICPCTKCVVKMICKNPCDEWGDYEDIYFDIKEGPIE